MEEFCINFVTNARFIANVISEENRRRIICGLFTLCKQVENAMPSWDIVA